jgi:flagellar motor switch/type III secretory pathway protein FliN
MIADLAARIEAAFGARAGAAPESVQVQDPWSGGSEALCAIVAEASGAEAVRMGIPLERAVAFRRGNMAPRRQRAAPASREQAIGTTRVDVRARLGSASLALAELRGLSPGDVLILDRGLEEPAELLAGRDDQILGRGRLDAAERITLILES